MGAAGRVGGGGREKRKLKRNGIFSPFCREGGGQGAELLFSRQLHHPFLAKRRHNISFVHVRLRCSVSLCVGGGQQRDGAFEIVSTF